MTMIDISNLDKLTQEQRSQFNTLLEQFPHLGSKMDSARELNTPTKMEEAKYVQPSSAAAEEMDYSNFMAPMETPRSTWRDGDLPKLKVNPEKSSFSSMEQEDDPKTLTPKEEASREERKQQQRVQAAIAAGQPPEIAGFRTEGKTHPVLQKMRATVGLRSVQAPTIVSLGGCNYSMRSLDRSHVTQATVLAMTTTDNSMLYQTNLEVAIIAFSIVAIDGVPMVDIFSIPKEETPLGESKPVVLTHLRREEKAAESFYMELLSSPNELVESLGIYYQQEFPPINLIGAGKSKFLCPAADCMQSRIADHDANCFCPIHGEKMAREDMLPNPL